MNSVNTPAEINDPTNGFPAPSQNDHLFRFSTPNPGNDITLQSNRKVFKLPNTFATQSIDGETHTGHFTANKIFTGTTDSGGLINFTLPTGSGAVEFIDSSSLVVLITEFDSSQVMVEVKNLTFPVRPHTRQRLIIRVLLPQSSV